jgi:hypothetical protein
MTLWRGVPVAPLTMGWRMMMNKCVGIEGKACGFEFDPGLEFPDDTLCDECFDEMAEEVE